MGLFSARLSKRYWTRQWLTTAYCHTTSSLQMVGMSWYVYVLLVFTGIFEAVPVFNAQGGCCSQLLGAVRSSDTTITKRSPPPHIGISSACSLHFILSPSLFNSGKLCSAHLTIVFFLFKPPRFHIQAFQFFTPTL